DSLERLASFPPAVRQRLGFALCQAQIGQKHDSPKMLHGFSEKVWRVRADERAGRIARYAWRRTLMVRPDRFELPTYWFVASCSIQLSYGRTLGVVSNITNRFGSGQETACAGAAGRASCSPCRSGLAATRP